MKFSFDAVFLDKTNRVIYLIEKMKPLQVSPIVFSAVSVLELAEGVIEKTDLQISDVLDFID